MNIEPGTKKVKRKQMKFITKLTSFKLTFASREKTNAPKIQKETFLANQCLYKTANIFPEPRLPGPERYFKKSTHGFEISAKVDFSLSTAASALQLGWPHV